MSQDLFGKGKDAELLARSNSSPINQIARQLFAMAAKKKESEVDLSEAMANARYQRTMTDDERVYPRLSGGRFKPVDPEQKAEWEILANK